MNIKDIQEQIAEADELMNHYRSVLREQPDDFVYTVSLRSLEFLIKDLQAQLVLEQEKREKEVLDIGLAEVPQEQGTIPLALLSDLSSPLFDSIVSASQFLITGSASLKTRFRVNLVESLDLRLAGLQAGSTHLIITGRTNPDLYGNSVLQRTLDETFELLQAETQDEIAESISKIGTRSASKINQFLKTLDRSEKEVTLLWYSPKAEEIVWEGDSTKIKTLVESLERLEAIPITGRRIVGELITTSLRGHIEVRTANEGILKILVPTERLEAIQHFHVGEQVSVTIEGETIFNKLTRRERSFFRLVGISTEL